MVVIQFFYMVNMYYDFFYCFGFDEIFGNFQVYNFRFGGKGGDFVVCNVQDGSGYNNVNFLIFLDGQVFRMRMYIWDIVIFY